MAGRAYWKGYLKLSLVSCPVKLYSATSASAGRISFNLLHKDTLNRVQQKYHDPELGEIDRADLVKGYQFEKDKYVVVTAEELDEIEIEFEQDHRHRRLRRRRRHRSDLSRHALLSRARRSHRRGDLRGHPRSHAQGEEGRRRAHSAVGSRASRRHPSDGRRIQAHHPARRQGSARAGARLREAEREGDGRHAEHGGADHRPEEDEVLARRVRGPLRRSADELLCAPRSPAAIPS